MIKHQLFTSDVDIESWLKFLNKSGVFDFVRVVCFALRQNIKEAYFMLSLVLTWSAFSEGVKVFGFPIMKPSFSFTNVKSIIISSICYENNSGLLWTITAKKDFCLKCFFPRLRWFLRNKIYRWIFLKFSLNVLYQALFRKIQ